MQDNYFIDVFIIFADNDNISSNIKDFAKNFPNLRFYLAIDANLSELQLSKTAHQQFFILKYPKDSPHTPQLIHEFIKDFQYKKPCIIWHSDNDNQILWQFYHYYKILMPSKNYQAKGLNLKLFDAITDDKYHYAQDINFSGIILKNNIAQHIQTHINELINKPKRLNIAVLLDYGLYYHSAHQQIHNALRNLPHNFIFINTAKYLMNDDAKIFNQEIYDLRIFDGVITELSMRLFLPDLYPYYQQLLHFSGLKIMLIQDDYNRVQDTLLSAFAIKFDVVYTVAPKIDIGQYLYANNTIKLWLAGYCPTINICQFAKPWQQRTHDIIYRGNQSPFYYGRLGNQKFTIADDFKNYIKSHHLQIRFDIENMNNKRFDGNEWLMFLASSKTMLATESGSSITDFDGMIEYKIRALRESKPQLTYTQAKKLFIKNTELIPNMQIKGLSPKFFEAIALKVVIIAFRGVYNDILIADRHYIAIEHDYSNMAEIFTKIQDDDFLQNMAQVAYDEVFCDEKNHYSTLTNMLKEDINSRVLHSAQYNMQMGIVSYRHNTNNEEYYYHANAKQIISINDQVNIKSHQPIIEIIHEKPPQPLMPIALTKPSLYQRIKSKIPNHIKKKIKLMMRLT